MAGLRRMRYLQYIYAIKSRDNETMDKRLLDILVCPVCKGTLHYQKKQKELICKGCCLAFPIRDEIPVMLEDEARLVTLDEKEKL